MPDVSSASPLIVCVHLFFLFLTILLIHPHPPFSIGCAARQRSSFLRDIKPETLAETSPADTAMITTRPFATNCTSDGRRSMFMALPIDPKKKTPI
jgi:hypothetical protein